MPTRYISPQKKKINGQIYKRFMGSNKKSIAQDFAKRARTKGYSARVIKKKDPYTKKVRWVVWRK